MLYSGCFTKDDDNQFLQHDYIQIALDKFYLEALITAHFLRGYARWMSTHMHYYSCVSKLL